MLARRSCIVGNLRSADKLPDELAQTKRPPTLEAHGISDPYGTRTRVAGVKGRSPRPLDEGASELLIESVFEGRVDNPSSGDSDVESATGTKVARK